MILYEKSRRITAALLRIGWSLKLLWSLDVGFWGFIQATFAVAQTQKFKTTPSHASLRQTPTPPRSFFAEAVTQWPMWQSHML
jgi:hypothetical protein